MVFTKLSANPKLRRLAVVGCYAVATLCLLAGLYWWLQIAFYPYQYELREGAPLVVVQNLLKGVNPYSFTTQPHHTYVYGILYPLLSLPLHALLGINIVNMRIMNLVFITLSTVLLFTASYRENRNLLFSYLLSVAFFLGLTFKTFHARPEALGILLLMSAVALPHRYNYSKRALAASILLSVLVFFTKPYYIIGIGYVCAHLFLFSSPKKSFLIFGSFLAALTAALLAAHWIWPVYINNNFLHHVGIATYSLGYALSQLQYFLSMEFLLIIVYIFFLGLAFYKERKENSPLLSCLASSLSVYDLGVFIVLPAFIVKLGGHFGAGDGDYLYHLMLPFLFLSLGVKGENLSSLNICQGLVLALLLAAGSIYTKRLRNIARPLPAYKAEIAKIEEYFKTGKNILSSAATVPLAIKYGIPVNDSGQSEYYLSGNKRPVRWIYGTKLADSDAAYKHQVQENISGKKYDYVFKTSWTGNYALPENFTNFYRLETNLSAPNIINGQLQEEIWVPLP